MTYRESNKYNQEMTYLLGGAVNKRSQRSGRRSRGNGGSLDHALVTANFLLDGLLEPGFHHGGPFLVEMLVGDD